MSAALWKALRARDPGALAKALRGADLATPDKSGLTPLGYAALHGDAESARLLLEAGADANAPMEHGVRALALSARHPEVCALLIGAADVDAASEAGVTALHRAAFWGATASVRALLDASADVNARDRHGRSALGIAVERAGAEIVAMLLDAGADPNVCEQATLDAVFPVETFIWPLGGRYRVEVAPLALACRPARAPLRRMLIERGAAADLAGAEGVSPLMVAAAHADREAVDDLLARGADPARVATGEPFDDWRGVTAAWLAIERGHEALAARLIDAGAALGAKGMRPLLRAAAARGWPDLVERLSDAGCDPNEADEQVYDAMRPLTAAAAAGHERVVALLLERGADPGPHEVDRDALHWANEGGHPGCIRLLSEAIAKGD